MKKLSRVFILILLIIIVAIPSGCSSQNANGQYIIDAKKAKELIGKENVVLVDAQNADVYAKEHIKGAANISRNDIVVNIPYPSMLAPKDVIEDSLGKNGISNNTTIIIYDNNDNMDAARLWWTLKVYGHENMKVISGGLKAMKATKFETTTDAVKAVPAVYTTKDRNTSLIASIDEVKAQVNDPKKNVVLLDTRSKKEFDEGTIPGSILIDYVNNNYKDGTYKSTQDIKIQYIENKITPDKTVIMYCKTSIRGAQTFLALYEAGYRNLKLYDGAWVEWSADKSLPVQVPEGTKKIEPSNKDNS